VTSRLSLWRVVFSVGLALFGVSLLVRVFLTVGRRVDDL
jgi:hypothetical protein